MSKTQLFDLDGKIAFVSGASRGIGEAIAKLLAQQGAHVIVSSRKLEGCQPVAEAIIANGGTATAMACHIGEMEQITRTFARIREEFGRLDILVNNAGVLAVGPLEDFSLEDFDRTLAINVRSVFIATQAAARYMTEGGRIINIGSTNAERMPFAGGGPYAMSKSALVGLTKGLARDLGPRGITINTVQPGPVDTDMNPATGDFAESLIPLMAIGRYGKADEIASFVAYLAGPESGYITGASLTADGGFSA